MKHMKRQGSKTECSNSKKRYKQMSLWPIYTKKSSKALVNNRNAVNEIKGQTKPCIKYLSSDDVEQKNMERCKDIKLHDSVIKHYLKKYKQNLDIARHYLKRLEIDIEEAKLMDKASLESELAKERQTQAFKKRENDLLYNSSLKDIFINLYPASMFLGIPCIYESFDTDRELIINLLALEKSSFKYFPISATSYFNELSSKLKTTKDLQSKIDLITSICEDLSKSLYCHPDDIQNFKNVFEEVKDDCKVAQDGTIEIL